MVAIFSGNGLGYQRSSASTLGATGLLGDASLGRGNDKIMVNAATGNLVVGRRDEFLVGRGPDAAYAQTYNSQAPSTNSWYQNFHRFLTNVPATPNAAGSTIARNDGDWRLITYTYDPARGAYLSTEGGGAHDELRYANGAWTWTDGDSRTTETYGALSGWPGNLFLTSVVDADGNAQTYNWNADGSLNRITNANGDYVQFTLGTNGLPTQVTTYTSAGAAMLTRTRYAWDSLKRLTSVTVDLTPGDHAVADGNSYTTTYTYDGSSSRIASIAQTDGSRLDIAYTQAGSDYRVTKLTQTVATGVTRVTGLYYDLASRTTTITDPLGGQTTLRYDSAGNLTEVVSPVPAPGAAAPTTTFAYAANGDVASVTAGGRTTAYSYDSNGNMVLSRAADGTTVTRTYGSKNELLTSSEYLEVDSDGAGSGTASSPLTTRYAYDSENHLRFVVSGEGRVTEYRYDEAGNPVSTLRYTANAYNVSGLAATASIAESTLAAWAAAVGDKTTIERSDTAYDVRGNVSTVTAYSKTLADGGGDLASTYTRTTYVYDAAGNLLSRVTTGQTGSDTFLYDGLNRVVSSTDKAGSVTTITFNDAATTTSVALAGGLSRVSVYNKAGELISLTESGSDVVSATTTAAYDALGRLRMTTDATGRSTYYFYDSAGRKVAEITGDGALTEFGYDSANRLVKSVSYLNRLSTSQIALLSNVSAGGAGGATAGGVSAGTGTSLLSNGGFETSGAYTATGYGRRNPTLPGWTMINGQQFEQVTSGWAGVNATEGTYWLDLDSILGTTLVPVGSNLLTNGSFDSSGSYTAGAFGRANSTLPGWVRAAGDSFEQVNSGFGGVNATDGAYWLDLDTSPSTTFLPVGSNLLTNGSFETSGAYTSTATGRANTTLPGWTKTNPEVFEQVVTGQLGVTASDGSYWLDLDSLSPAGLQTGPNLVSVSSWPSDPNNLPAGAAALSGWQNPVSTLTDVNESRWAASAGLNGTNTVVMQAGQADADRAGGGNYTNAVTIDGTKQYEFTYYVKQPILGKHMVVMGLNPVSGYVEDAVNGGGVTTPSFIELPASEPQMLQMGFVANRWYKVVGYVLPQGSGNVAYGSKGGVYDTVTGTKVWDTNVFRWSAARPDNNIYSRQNVYDAYNRAGYFTDFLPPEIREVTGQTVSGSSTDMSQVVSGLAAGQVMQLQFSHANRTTAASGSFEVWWNGTLVATVADTGAAMQEKSYQVIAQAGDNSVRFKSTGTRDGSGASIDNVRLFATTPGPVGGNLDISQTVNVASAGTMQLQFDHANRTTAGSGSFEVWWNGALVATVNSTGTAMQAKTYQVSAVAGSNTLRFVGTGTADGTGASIDNVRLFAMQVDPNSANMHISQTVSGLAAGQGLLLQFDHANRTTAASGSFEVWWNDALVATIAETGTTMTAKSYSLTAIAGNNTLLFKGTGTGDAMGASLDNVRLFTTQSGPAAPTPTDPLAGLRPTASADDSWTWRIYDNADRLIETIDSVGRATTFTYDGASRLVSSTAYANAIASSTVAGFKTVTPTAPVLPAANAVTDRLARNFYDAEGRLVGTLDGAGGLTQIFHNAAGEKIREIAYANPVAANLRATGTFAQLLASAGTTTSDRRADAVYDRRGLVRFTVDSTGHPTEFVYDAAGQLVRTVDYAGAIAPSASYSLAYIQSQLSSTGLATNASNRTARTVFDGAGRAAFAIDAEGATVAFGYDQDGRVIKETRYVALFTAAGDQTLAAMQGWASSHAADAGNRVVRTIYDVAGRAAYIVDAEGFVTEQRYDSASRLTQTIRYPSAYPVGDGATKTSLAAQIGALPATAVVTSYAYDPAGRLADRTDGAGIITRFVYDALGQVTDETVAWNTSHAVTLHRVYDAAGRVLSETRAYGATEAATTSYAYDAVGNLLTVTDPRSSVTTRQYDTLGRVVSETSQVDSSTSVTVTQAYNALGQLAARTDARGFAEYFYYDSTGRRTLHVDREGYATRTHYNSFGEVGSVVRYAARTSGTATAATPPTIVTGAGDATTSFLYDRSGRVVRTTDAVGHYEEYSYDAFGQRVSVRNKLGGYTYNSFDRRGLLTSETLPTVAYDKWGNVTAWSVTNRFSYDSRGNRTEMIEAYGLAEQRVTGYVYDKLDRLTKTQSQAVTVLSQSDHATASSVTPTQSYKYDRLGRLIETIDALGARTNFYYDKLHRKIAELRQTDVNGTGALSTYGYDANGNLLSSRVYGTAIAVPVAGGAVPAAPGGEYRETTYTYDKLDRVKTTSVANVRTGAWNGSAYATGIGTVTTTVEYDANGNVTKATNGNGASSFSYYDKASRPIAVVDEENYLTVWTLDAEGNVTEETRLANKVTAAVSTATDPGALRTTVPASGADRTTQFVYDRNGRRTSETRLNVSAHALDGGGALVAGVAHSTIGYSYNGLGQVTQKTFANNDYISYNYDSAGRLREEYRAPFTDLNGASVRPTTIYFYDALGNLSLTRLGGIAAAAGDRYTRYTYGAGGRLAQMTDAAGNSYNYSYDAAGNVLRESYDRVKSDGIIVTEGLLYNRDALGRVVSQALATWNGSGWAKGDSQDTAYNAYGDVAQRGVNGGWQEQFAYDGAGRTWRSNSGDGVWRFFVHDGAGNQTLILESEGANLAGHTLDQALGVASANGVYAVGGAYIDGINATINVFDKRGQAVQTRTPQRQLSGTAAAVDLAVSRTYNAFGEVASEIDARGFTTDFSYNTMGRLIQKQSPTVAFTIASTTVSYARPTEKYHYDVAGRMIATDTYVDTVNFNRLRRSLLEGTGHDGSEALVTAEYHGDNGVFRTYYDVYGDARILRNELYAGHNAVESDEIRTYDAMGRLIQQNHRGGLLIDYYAYDLLGQRTKHWNSFFGGGVVETTDYDRQGRVTRTVAFDGDTTITGYAWSGGIVTSGMGYFGGWEKTVSRGGYSSAQQIDLFGRELNKTDLGGHYSWNGYDLAGRLVSQNGGSGQTQTLTYLNTGRVSQIADSPSTGNGVTATFGYDAAGNRTAEAYAGAAGILQNAAIEYDALGRMTAFNDYGGGTTVMRSFTNQYDLAGNIRHAVSIFPDIAYPGRPALGTDYWFDYDSMNRMTIANGELVGGAVSAANKGVAITYDAAGRRRTVTQEVWMIGSVEVWVEDPPSGDGPPYEYDEEIGGGEGPGGHSETRRSDYLGTRREEYEYRADGYLMNVRMAEDGYYDGGNGIALSNEVMGAALLRATNSRDAIGRVTQYQEFDAGASSPSYNRYAIAYDYASRVTSEVLSQKRKEGGVWYTYVTTTTNSYGGPLGALSSSGASITKSWTNSNGGTSSSSSSSSTTNYHVVWDDARLSSSTSTNAGISGTSTYTYDGMGRVASVGITGSRARTVTFTNAPTGQVLSRIESSSAATNPADFYYYVDGVQVGELTSNGFQDPTRSSYSDTIITRNWNFNPTQPPQAFRWDTAYGITRGQFGGPGYDPISPVSQGMEGSDGAYTVRDGDTLQSIAASFWGDASLWYLLAEANGLTGAEYLAGGTNLVIPDKVTNIHNRASTFEVYDPNRALGDLSPSTVNTAKPRKANKCGIFGTILVLVVAAVATRFLGPIGGNLVTQGFANLIGQQKGFSWKSLALSVITHEVAGAMNASGVFSGIASTTLRSAATAVAANAATQGIGVALGLQKKFDFAGVAAAGAGAAAGAQIRIAGPGGDMLRTAADGIAGAAARSLVNGTSFGDNIMAVLPDVIGRSLGNAMADAISGAKSAGQLRRERAAAHEEAHNLRLAAPAPGEAGGQIGSDDIVITGRRRVVTDAEIALELELAAREEALLAEESAATGAPDSSDSLLDGVGIFPDATKGDTTPLIYLAGLVGLDESARYFADGGRAFAAEYLGGSDAAVDVFTRFGGDLVAEAFLRDPTGFKLRGARATLARFAGASEYADRYGAAIKVVDAGLDLIYQSMESGLMTELQAFGREYVRIGSYANPFLAAAETTINYSSGNITASEAAVQLATMGKVGRFARLPRSGGRWEGTPGNGLWHSNNAEVNRITGGNPIRFVEGRPDFSPWSKGSISFRDGVLNGTRDDFNHVYDFVARHRGLPNRTAAKNYLSRAGLTPHHANGTTIQLIPTKLHGNVPHVGSASDLRRGF